MPSRSDLPDGEIQERLAKLRAYFEKHYGISIVKMERLDRGVCRIDRKEGKSWVARIFPESRPIDQVKSDAGILQFLEKNGFSAEGCATSDPVTNPGGRGVPVTVFMEGKSPEPAPLTFRKFADILGVLNSLSNECQEIMQRRGDFAPPRLTGEALETNSKLPSPCWTRWKKIEKSRIKLSSNICGHSFARLTIVTIFPWPLFIQIQF